MNACSLFAVVFEVKLNAERADDYLHIAAGLRPELDTMPGFLENERFRSRSREGYLLSLSLWDSEKALVRWRTAKKHHEGQARGRTGVLDDYRIRVGEVTRVTGPYSERHVGWMRQDHTEASEAAALTIIDGVLTPESTLWAFARTSLDNALDGDSFDHLAIEHRTITLASWRTQDEADSIAERAIRHNDVNASIYAIRTVRSYGLQDRREAPQYYPPV